MLTFVAWLLGWTPELSWRGKCPLCGGRVSGWVEVDVAGRQWHAACADVIGGR